MSLAYARQDHADATPLLNKPPLSLIELFSPRSSAPLTRSSAESAARKALWTADAIHRANNLAQLATGLVSLNSRFPTTLRLADTEGRIRELANVYAELGREGSTHTPTACKPLLREIVTALTELFGKPIGIGICFNGCEIFLPADARRALILIASELVINALKYAFPAGRSGTIDVSLWEDGGEGQLAVGDDGIGFVGSNSTGQGSGLVHDLGTLFAATVGRSNLNFGHLVWVRFPVQPTVRIDASATPNSPGNLDRVDDAGGGFDCRANSSDKPTADS